MINLQAIIFRHIKTYFLRGEETSIYLSPSNFSLKRAMQGQELLFLDENQDDDVKLESPNAGSYMNGINEQNQTKNENIRQNDYFHGDNHLLEERKDAERQVNYNDQTINNSIDNKTNYQRQDQPKKTYEPSEKELCQTILLLKKIMPNRSIERAIIMLYQTIVKKVSVDDLYPTQADPIQQYNPPEIENGKQQKQYVPDSNQIVRQYKKEDCLQKSFSSEAEQNTYKERRLCAKAFVGKGYGLTAARDQFKAAKFTGEMDKIKYKSTMFMVIRSSFQVLEGFLTQDCNHPGLKPFKNQDYTPVMTSLMSASTHYKDKYKTFYKYIRMKYGLSNATFSENQSAEFYIEVCKKLYKKPIESISKIQEIQRGDGIHKNSEERTTLESRITLKDLQDLGSHLNKVDADLIKMYLVNRNISGIFEKMQERNGLQSSVVKGKFKTLMRAALRKVQGDYSKDNMHLTAIQSDQIEIILKCSEGLECRLALFMYYLKKDEDIRGLKNAGESIEKFIHFSKENKVQEEESLCFQQMGDIEPTQNIEDGYFDEDFEE